MNPQQPAAPPTPPPNPIGPDIVVPGQSNGVPGINITENNSPQYDPNYIPAVGGAPAPAAPAAPPAPAPAVASSGLPDVVPAQAPNPSAQVGPIEVNNGNGNDRNDLIKKIAIGLGGLILLGLLIFAVWWLFLRSSEPATASIENTVAVGRNVNGISYEFTIPDGASENRGAELEINDPLDNYAFSQSNDAGELEFAGNSFVQAELESEDSVSVYDESFKAELASDLEAAHGLSSVEIADPIDFTSEGVQEAVSSEIIGQGQDGVTFNGRIVTTLVNDKIYNFYMMAPTDDWQANTAKINEIFASFKVNDQSSNPLVQPTGDELDVDLSVSLEEVRGPTASGVSEEDVLEYRATVSNGGPDAVKSSSADIEFSVGNEIVEIVAISDDSNSFDCDTAVGERTSVTGEMKCTIITDIAVDESVTMSVQYKHVSDFTGSVAASSDLAQLSAADWKDNDNTSDSSDASTYSFVESVVENTENSENTNTENTNTEESTDLPDTSGGESVSLIVPAAIAVISAALMVAPKGRSYIKLDR